MDLNDSMSEMSGRELQVLLLTRPQKTINFFDKKVIFNFKIVLFSESLYFRLSNATKIQRAMGQISFYEFYAK